MKNNPIVKPIGSPTSELPTQIQPTPNEKIELLEGKINRLQETITTLEKLKCYIRITSAGLRFYTKNR